MHNTPGPYIPQLTRVVPTLGISVDGARDEGFSVFLVSELWVWARDFGREEDVESGVTAGRSSVSAFLPRVARVADEGQTVIGKSISEGRR